MSPSLRGHICQAIAKHCDIAQQSLRNQWEQLILQPLSMLESGQLQLSNLVLVIDALDECEREEDVRVILGLFAEAKTLNSAQLRIFITSRPEIHTGFGFYPIPKDIHQDFVLHKISQSIIQNNISIFIKHELANVKEKHKLTNIRKEYTLPADWPGEQIIERLFQKADGLFIYAATACRFIGDLDWSPEDRLCLALRDDTAHGDGTAGQSPTRELDEMYSKVLNQQVKPELSKRFKQIVGSIVILFDSLSATALAELLDVPELEVYRTLVRLHSILEVPENQDSLIRLLHPSFREFLLDKQRCKDPQFWVEEEEAHKDLAKRCLRFLSKSLRRDICGLRVPGALTSEVEKSRVDRYLSVPVRYACRYWVGHIQQGSLDLCDNDQVYLFLQKHFLHWLEALSLMGNMSDGFIMVSALESMLIVSDSVCTVVLQSYANLAKLKPNRNLLLLAMTHDAKRFILNFRYIIERRLSRYIALLLCLVQRTAKSEDGSGI
jgi:hypothetical protein